MKNIALGIVMLVLLSIFPSVYAQTDNELLRKAEQAVKNSDFEEALEFLNKILIDNPNDQMILNNKGAVLVELENYSEAVLVFEQILGSNPSDIGALVNQGVALIHLEHYDDAILNFDAVLEIDAKNTQALNNRSTAFKKIGILPLSESDYEGFVQITVRNAQGHLVSVTESKTLSFVPHMISDELLMSHTVVDIIQKNNQKYEKRIIETVFEAQENTFVSSVRLVFEKYNDPTVVFFALNHAFTVQQGDVAKATWTILKPISS